MFKKISISLLFFVSPFLVFGQKKTLLKFEFPVGIMPGNNLIFRGQPFSIMYPTIYIPLHQHLDIGASYNSQKVNYYVAEQDPVDFSYKFYKGNINYKVTSFYLKINLSASQKRVNPFFSYVLSFSKGTYTSPTRDSTSSYYSANSYYVTNTNAYENGYGDNQFSYRGRMNVQEEAKFKKALDKSQMSHGIQLGLDYKILPFLNLFVKATTFSVVGYNKSGFKNAQPFPTSYKEDVEKFQISPQQYYMFGIILKIDAGKKSLIK